MLTRLGLLLPSRIGSLEGSDPFTSVVGLAEAAELSGFDSIWVADRQDTDSDSSFEAYTLLGALAVRTTSARLGALVSSVTHRNPGILAKQVTALDILSSGRAVLGVGPGGAQPDHGAVSEAAAQSGPVHTESDRRDPERVRYDRFEEALEVLGALLGKSPANAADISFAGSFFRLDGAPNRPRPVQDGRLPVLIGDSNDETLKLVARYGDACSLVGDPTTIRLKLSVLDRHMEDFDRDPGSLTKTALIPVGRLLAGAKRPESIAQQVADYLEVGIDGIIAKLPDEGDRAADHELASVDLVSAIGRALLR